jgi:hypothetical protein
LPRDADAICQFRLRPVELSSKNPETIFHWKRRRTTTPATIQETMNTA